MKDHLHCYYGWKVPQFVTQFSSQICTIKNSIKKKKKHYKKRQCNIWKKISNTRIIESHHTFLLYLNWHIGRLASSPHKDRLHSIPIQEEVVNPVKHTSYLWHKLNTKKCDLRLCRRTITNFTVEIDTHKIIMEVWTGID